MKKTIGTILAVFCLAAALLLGSGTACADGRTMDAQRTSPGHHRLCKRCAKR